MAKSYDAFIRAVADSESSNRYDVENSLGFLGRFQFGEAALVDLGYYSYTGDPTRGGGGGDTSDNDWLGQWTGKDGVKSKEDFRDNINGVQDKAFRAWVELNWRRIQNKGLDRYVGQIIRGIPITESGLIGAAHLGGVGGLRVFLASKGMTDRAEEGKGGTKISDYLQKFAGYETPFVARKPFENKRIPTPVFKPGLFKTKKLP